MVIPLAVANLFFEKTFETKTATAVEPYEIS